MFYLWYLQTGILQYFHWNIAICLFVSIKTKMLNIHIVAYRLVNIRKEAYACLWRFLWFGFLPLLKTYVAVKHAVFRKNFCGVCGLKRPQFKGFHLRICLKSCGTDLEDFFIRACETGLPQLPSTSLVCLSKK